MAGPETPYFPETSSKPTLADLLTIENSASIFYSYARELELSKGLSDKSFKMTLFVPTNKAVMSLARKPHEGNMPVGGSIEISDAEFDSIVKNNVERWVSAHIVPEAPISLEGVHHTLHPSKSITFKGIGKSNQGPEWIRVSLEDGIHITGKKEAINGDLYMIDGVISSIAETLE
ncbi:hypothetical protein DFP72DRAFT_992239 [Ephemerocybe angulata]|uniref:FAS1 domain-containing protein n=1 Tax=Ephemerocybe angulata TaxID=980116 RepID=A0A8H6HL29_9AGAR|nr:hypothetical protein DFP72DRAFT_992239 [Tulosesus angulatus]